MRKRALATLIITLLVSMLTLAVDIRSVGASGAVYIRADGSVDPPTAPIHRNGSLYTLTGNIVSDADGIVIERDNMTLDGAGYALQGSGSNKGIYMSGRSNVTIKNIAIKSFLNGVYLNSSSCNTVSASSIENNQIGVSLRLHSYSNIISKNGITANNGWGIELYESSGNTIIENNVTNNTNNYGVYFYSSSYNDIRGNNITNNWNGIHLYLYSDYNHIFDNNIKANKKAGIYLSYSSNNVISGNNISDNLWVGVDLYVSSENNRIYHNNLVDNAPYQARAYYLPNSWDNGYPSGGNYWSDYTGGDLFMGFDQNETGSDGIGDMDYVIDSGNRDRYPLMNPWTPRPEPYIAHPLNCSLICGNETRVGAIEMNLASDIMMTEFSYAHTIAGPWTLIALDLNSTDGWGATWNLTGLSEGDYIISAWMINNASQSGEDLVRVYYDPTPPYPTLTGPTFPTFVSGVANLTAYAFNGSDISFTDWSLLDGYYFSGCELVSKNVSELHGTALGGVSFGCGPTAAASCLAYWDNYTDKNNKRPYDGLYNEKLDDVDPKDGVKDGLAAMAKKIRELAGTDEQGGTDPGRLADGINKYVNDPKIAVNLVAKLITKTDNPPASLDFAIEQFLTCQDVILCLKLPNGRGHGVTMSSVHLYGCIGMAPYLAGTPTGLIDYMDPADGKTHFGDFVDKDKLRGDWNWDGVIGMDEVAELTEIITVCPKSPEWALIGEDFDGTDGWSVTWDTTQLPDAFYLVKATMTDTKGNMGEDLMLVYINNARITDIASTKTVVGEGYSVGIQVSVENLFVESAFFNITLYANETVIEAKNITLASKTSTILQFTWNTADVPKGNYTISAKIDAILNETNGAHITYIDNWILITIPGDVDGDFDVDLYDAVRLLTHYGVREGEEGYDPNLDLDGDGRIFLYDAVILCTHYGQKDP